MLRNFLSYEGWKNDDSSFILFLNIKLCIDFWNFKIYNLLKNDLDISLIKTDSNIFDRNLVVVPSYVSKGLEFDSVIIYTEKDNKYTDDEKYLYYVSCTRCQHELVIYNQEDWLTNKNRL